MAIFLYILTVLLAACSTDSFSGEEIKPTFRYSYKAEVGAYIEAKRKETFSLCPEKDTEGTWVSEYSVSLDENNCLSVLAPNLAGTFNILFMNDNGRTDTIQVLVEQSYIEMGNYSHRMWVPDSLPSKCKHVICGMPPYGHYEIRSYNQPLIVDKTKFTMGDAQHYSKTSNIELANLIWERVYPKNEKLEESLRPYVRDANLRFANERSKKEGLDTVYHIIENEKNNKKLEKFIVIGNVAIDTSALGYRLPLEDEWFYLMRAGASTKYYWGDQEDSLTVSRYAWVNPIGLKPVAQKPPNKFGLYDMVGLTNEMYIYIYDKRKDNVLNFNAKMYVGDYAGYNTVTYCFNKPECDFIGNIGTLVQRMGKQNFGTCELRAGESELRCPKIEEKPVLITESARYNGFRLVRKTPKLQKLEKF